MEKSDSKGFNGGGGWAVLLKIVEVLIAVFIPLAVAWGVWATQELNKHAIELKGFTEWRNIAPRFTSVDAENLRMRVSLETSERVAKPLAEINAKLDDLTLRFEKFKTQIESAQKKP